MSRSKKVQVLFVGGNHDGSHKIVDATMNGEPLQHHLKLMSLKPMSTMHYSANEATIETEYTVYQAEQLRDPQDRRYWVYVASGVNLMAALIDGYRRQA